jgi:hypothetical protein
MVQATNGLLVPNVAEGKAVTCSVCGKMMKFEDTPEDKDPVLYGLATATHCDTRHIINPIGYRIETAPTPEKGPYPPRDSEEGRKREREIKERAQAVEKERKEAESGAGKTAATTTSTSTGTAASKSDAEIQAEKEKAERDAKMISEEAADARVRKQAKGISSRIE